MLEFTWLGTDVRGHEQRGTCAAAGLAEAAAQLRAKGLTPLSIDRVDAETASGLRVTADSFALFNRNLAEMTGIGMALPAAVREISSSLRRSRFKTALQPVESALREGQPLEEAMAAAPASFPLYYRRMVQAGGAPRQPPPGLSATATRSRPPSA